MSRRVRRSPPNPMPTSAPLVVALLLGTAVGLLMPVLQAVGIIVATVLLLVFAMQTSIQPTNTEKLLMSATFSVPALIGVAMANIVSPFLR
jgi:uncharacterized integral membrane protein